MALRRWHIYPVYSPSSTTILVVYSGARSELFALACSMRFTSMA